jgi:hypothetical protein
MFRCYHLVEIPWRRLPNFHPRQAVGYVNLAVAVAALAALRSNSVPVRTRPYFKKAASAASVNIPYPSVL